MSIRPAYVVEFWSISAGYRNRDIYAVFTDKKEAEKYAKDTSMGVGITTDYAITEANLFESEI